MPLEKQVVGLAISQRLKELGVRQESAFYWEWFDGFNGRILNPAKDRHGKADHSVAAFTVPEIGELMKTARQGDFIKAYHHFMQTPYTDSQGPYRALMAHNLMTEPNYGAKMLIYLIENKLITL